MKYGQVSPAVTDRSIIRPLASCLSGTDAYGQTGISSGAVGGFLDRRPEMILAEAVNSLHNGGADVPADPAEIHLTMSAALAPDTPEKTLKQLMQRCGAWIRNNGFGSGDAAAYVSDAVRRPVLTVCAQAQTGDRGQKIQPQDRKLQDIQPQDIQLQDRKLQNRKSPDIKQYGLYMAGYAGLAGTAILAEDLAEELSRCFPGVWLERAKSFDRYLLISGEGDVGRKMPPETDRSLLPGPAQNVAEGGILAALWHFSGRLKCGIDVDLRRIPIRQETIEICERLTIHPYQLYTCGAVLLAADAEDEERLRKLRESYDERDIPFARIGSLTERKAGILRSGDEIRYLEKPQQDALAVLAQRHGSYTGCT